MPEYTNMTARALVGEMQSGRLDARDVTRYYLERISTYDGKLNAVAELDTTALSQAEALESRGDRRLPLFGMPVLIKDNIDVRGLHTTAGSLALADNIAQRDAPVVANLRKNGAVILGKTNMTELANYTSAGMPGGFSARGGQVKNAYGEKLDASGSSSGSAAAMSAGFCAAAVGTDTSFSVVACATVHGVVGLKPAHGALSGEGIVPIARTLDSAGALTRDFADALLLYNGMRDTPLPEIAAIPPERLSIAMNVSGREMVSDTQMGLYDRLLSALKQDGVSVTEISQTFTPHQKTVMRCEFARDMNAYLAGANASVKNFQELYAAYERSDAPYGYTYLTAALSSGVTDADYIEAMAAREEMRERLPRELAGYDACIMTGPVNIMHFAGLASLSLPLAMVGGAPRGVILYGADETRLLSAALTIERYCPWVKDGEGKPPVLAE